MRERFGLGARRSGDCLRRDAAATLREAAARRFLRCRRRLLRSGEVFGGFDPLGDDDLGIGNGFFISGSVGHAAGEFGYFDEEGLIFFAPVDDEFVEQFSRFPVDI